MGIRLAPSRSFDAQMERAGGRARLRLIFFFFFFFFFFLYIYIYIFIYLPTRLQFFNKGKNIKKGTFHLKNTKDKIKTSKQKSLITKKKKHRLHD